MGAGKHGSSEITVTLDDAAGTPRAITNFVLTMGGVKIKSGMQKTDAYGDGWDEFLPTGKQGVDKIAIHGYFDDTATTGPHVVMGVPDSNPQGTSRTLTVVFGNAKTVAGECWVESYEVAGKNDNLTEFDGVLQPTGAWAWS